MSKARKQAPWKVRVGKKEVVLAEFEVPYHKMGSRQVETFLRALVVRYRTDSPEEMVPYYVNGKAGHPARMPFANVIHAYSEDQVEQGYFCGEWECFASAMYTIDAAAAEAVRHPIEQNRAARPA